MPELSTGDPQFDMFPNVSKHAGDIDADDFIEGDPLLEYAIIDPLEYCTFRCEHHLLQDTAQIALGCIATEKVTIIPTAFPITTRLIDFQISEKDIFEFISINADENWALKYIKIARKTSRFRRINLKDFETTLINHFPNFAQPYLDVMMLEKKGSIDYLLNWFVHPQSVNLVANNPLVFAGTVINQANLIRDIELGMYGYSNSELKGILLEAQFYLEHSLLSTGVSRAQALLSAIPNGISRELEALFMFPSPDKPALTNSLIHTPTWNKKRRIHPFHGSN